MGTGIVGTTARNDWGMSLKWISLPLELPGDARVIEAGPKTPFCPFSKSIPISATQFPYISLTVTPLRSIFKDGESLLVNEAVPTMLRG